MGLLKKIGSMFGMFRDDNSDVHQEGVSRSSHDQEEEEEEEEDQLMAGTSCEVMSEGGVRKGFSVKRQVIVERPAPAAAAAAQGPLIRECDLGQGGVQGFRWYIERLRVDEDGDVADEFFDEVLTNEPQSVAMATTERSQPHFQIRCSGRPVQLRNQTTVVDGNILQSAESNGTLTWV